MKPRTPLGVDHRERGEQTEPEHPAVGRVERFAQQQSDAHARDRRLPERGAEKRHAPRDNQMADASQQRREQQDADEAANEKRIFEEIGEAHLGFVGFVGS